MNTQENNRLIAVFMGFVLCNEEYETPHTQWKWMASFMGGEGYDTTQDFSIEEMQFHTSWDWLMPVVEKIESLGYSVVIETSPKTRQIDIYDNKTLIHFKHPKNAKMLWSRDKISKLDSIYKAVVEFILWYNENK